MSKATSSPQANHTQCSSSIEVLNLIVESKSLPAEVIDLNICPLRRKKSLQSYYSVDFDFLALMRSYHNIMQFQYDL